MQANDSAALESVVTDDCTDLDQRDVRALTEYMTVLPLGGDVYSVTTESGSEYRVDTREGRCTCPDTQHNLPDEKPCKHERRVHFATGHTTLPAWVNPDAIDDQLGLHTDAAPTKPTTDGGTVGPDRTQTPSSDETADDDPSYTYHYEPAHVGGARYVRCTACGAECIPADPDRMHHRDGCSEGQR